MDIRIYQINDEWDNENFREKILERMDRQSGVRQVETIDASVYDRVFSGAVESKNLEDVYNMFRYNPPKDYVGQPPRRTDVVEVVKDDDSKFYFLASYGMFRVSFDPSKAQDFCPKQKPLIELGLRLGGTLKVTQEELDKLGENDMSAEKLLVKLIQSGRFQMGGDTYFPKPWNEDYLDDDLNFDLPEAPLIPQRKPSLNQKIQDSQPQDFNASKNKQPPAPER